MGVQGLWELLAPVGRRVSVETLAGKKLAIDASIWMVQFMKAMRDEQGEMIRNAHLIGFFRRICKLLFLRTKPVFVFDGGTPALKRRTVIARRRQRENAQTKIRKTAEKLLLNHLKSMRLKELADNLEKQRKENEAKRKLPKGVVIENIETADRGNVASELVKDVEKNDLKGKSIMVDEEVEMYDGGLKSDENATRRFDQETLDAMLAASLAEEEDGIAAGYASTSVNDDIFSEEDDDEEEMMLPVIDGKVDPSILASLPPSMQLDLLVQMRERLMAENRQKYQKVKKAPAKFSELQIQSYLKTVAFRREINEVQKSAAGKDIGGVQTSRIASEANREFIFSSSFTGDKQILTSAGVGKNGERELQTTGKGPACSDSSKRVSSVTMLSSELLEAGPNRPTNDLNDVETYVDERGRIRVSRVRAMGIRMTRDLQRNLDLMKEIQQEKETPAEEREAIFNKIVLGDSETFSVNNHHMESSNQGNGIYSSFDDSEIQSEEPQILENRSAMNISFSEDDIVSKDAEDDDIFAQLVAGGSVAMSPHGNDASDCSWEEGIIDEKGVSSSDIADKEKLMSSDKVNIIDEDEMDWEDVVCNATEDGLTCPTVPVKTVSKGSLEEEANMAEAIRISLEDFTGEKSMLNSENENFEVSNITFKVNTVRPDLMTKNDVINLLNLPVENATLPSQTSFEAVAGPEKLDHVINNSARQIDLSIELESRNDEKVIMLHKQCEENLVSGVAGSSEARGECGKELSFVGSKCSSMISSPVSAGMMSDTTGVCLSKANENDNIAKPTVHSGAVTETEKSLEELSSDSLSSSSDKKQNLATEKNLDVPEEEIKNTKDDSTIQGMEVPIDVSEASLDEEMQNLRQERIDLGDEQRKLERTAESVSSEMFAECQELLQMFGLPYIIAPMEAEAQCAYLELAKLVDGVVTDDSDVFLFGARNVYKNIFDDRKYVETYYMKDVESELGLSREQLIRMALLLGSDYTEGVSGIGIVNAIEVVNAFPEEDGLQKFREWLESPDPTILGKLDTQTGSTPRKRGSNGSNNDTESSKEMDAGTGGGENGSAGPDDKGSTEIVEETKRTFMNKHRNVSKNWHIPSSFPSEAVVSAYVSPQVDKSTESFSWGKPDLAVLRKLCWEKFGWNNQRSDDLLLPVLKEYNKHETQLRLEAFYTFNERFAKIRSQRIKKALKGITGKKSTELMGDLPDESSRRTMSSSEPDKFVDNSNVEEDMNAESKCGMRNKAAPKKRRKNIQNIPVSNESGEPSVNKEERHYTKKASSGNMRERGRGRGRGRQVGRGKRKVAPDYESPEAISNDRNDSDGELESQVEKTESLSEVRRSARPRKHVMYMENDSDLPGLTKPVDQGGVLNKHEVADRGQDCDGDICRDPANDPIDEDSERVLKGASDGDYLEMGGGFCFEEDKQEKVAVQLEPTRRRLFDCDESNQSLEDRYSGDYLAMGGGFCVDKGEPDNEQVPPVISPTRELDEDATRRSPSSSAGIRDAMGVLQEDKLPKADTLSTTGLTAIPFLRRKRRKT